MPLTTVVDNSTLVNAALLNSYKDSIEALEDGTVKAGSLNIGGLTEETTVDLAADSGAILDATGNVIRRVLLKRLHPITTKGDLTVGNASGVPGRLAAGTDGHVLTLDSAQTLGVKWAEPAGGASDFITVLDGVMAAVGNGVGDVLVESGDYLGFYFAYKGNTASTWLSATNAVYTMPTGKKGVAIVWSGLSCIPTTPGTQRGVFLRKTAGDGTNSGLLEEAAWYPWPRFLRSADTATGLTSGTGDGTWTAGATIKMQVRTDEGDVLSGGWAIVKMINA